MFKFIIEYSKLKTCRFLSRQVSIHKKMSCSLAVVQSCSRAVVQSCSLAVVQSCSRTVVQSCSQEPVWILVDCRTLRQQDRMTSSLSRFSCEQHLQVLPALRKHGLLQFTGTKEATKPNCHEKIS